MNVRIHNIKAVGILLVLGNVLFRDLEGFNAFLVCLLYDLVITPKRDFLWSREDIDRFWTIDGNYEGTELYLYIKHDGEEKR